MEKRRLLVGTVLYLTLPLFFFAYGWLRKPYAAIVMVLLVMFLIPLARDVRAVNSRLNVSDLKGRSVLGSSLGAWFLIPVMATFWVSLSGVGGFGFQTTDYLASNALLKDLIERSWPLVVPWDAGSANIVYYMGWYLPAAFVGKLWGWAPANIFTLVWAVIGVYLSLGWFWRICSLRSPSRVVLLIVSVIFFFAGGLDFVGHYVFQAQILDWTNPLHNLEKWTFLEYSSTTTLMYWVPQHAIPAWLMTGLIVDGIYGSMDGFPYLGICLTGCLIASPFGVIGNVPYVVILLVRIWKDKMWHLLFKRSSLVLNLLALPIATATFLYLFSNKFSFPKGFLWEFTDNPLIFVGWIEFCLIEFGILSIFVLAGFVSDKTAYSRNRRLPGLTWNAYLQERHGIESWQFILFIVSLVVLALLPAYKFGYSGELVMRGSMASLFIFWSFIGKIATDSGFTRHAEFRLPYILIVIILVIGLNNSLAQMNDSIRNYHFGPPDKNAVQHVETANYIKVVEQRIGNDDTFFYRYLGK